MGNYIVMQGRTYNEENKAGIIWSPQEDQSGRKQHSWERMREVRKGDIVFHYVNGFIVAISTATADCIESPKPTELQNNNNWNQEGYKVTLDYHELEVPLRVIDHFDMIKPLLPIKYSAFQANGQGNQGYLYPCNDELTVQLLELIREVDNFVSVQEQGNWTDDSKMKSDKSKLALLISHTESVSKTKIRVGQDKFRKKLEPIWNGVCPICGIKLRDALRASHSKPWKDSTDQERLDLYNGILLCCNHDSLYDNGYVSFDEDGNIIISKEMSEEEYDKFFIKKGIKISVFPEHKPYFNWHKRYVFKG